MADTTKNRAASPPQQQITMVEKAIVILLLVLGLVVLGLLAGRIFFRPGKGNPTPTPKPTHSASPVPTRSAEPPPSAKPSVAPNAALPSVDQIRMHFREDQPAVALKEVTQVLEADTDAITKDQSLVELEQNMERMDRTQLYAVLDEPHKKGKTAG